jgi:hypothetical protein
MQNRDMPVRRLSVSRPVFERKSGKNPPAGTAKGNCLSDLTL